MSGPFAPERAAVTERSDARRDVRWLVGVFACSVLGIAAVAGADAASRHGWSYAGASVFFWIGLLLLFVPVAVRALMPETCRRDRIALIVLLAVGLYVVKVLASPSAFTFSDEFTHLRDVQDILRTHHLFANNPLLPTAAYYPGLGAVTAGLVDLTGLSPFVAGLMVIGVTRVLFTVSLFLLARKVTQSDRAAAAASLIYIANPMFLFFSSTFSYENLALPLAVFAIWWIARTRQRADAGTLAAAALVIVAVAMTHHVSGLALTALLIIWWSVERRFDLPSRANLILGVLTLFTTAAVLLWLFVIARPAATYLFSQNIEPALRNTGSLLLHQTARRHLYSSGGISAPRWESLIGFAAIGLLLIALPFGIRRAWPRRRWVAMAVAIAMAIAYPLSLIPRLAPTGVAISGRSSEYLFAGLGCVLGLLAFAPPYAGGRHARISPATSLLKRHRSAVFAALLAIVFVGDVTIGTAFYERLPEDSHPSGYPYLVQSDAIAASTWARAHLGINQRFGSNAIDADALATYGEQDPVPAKNVWQIFFPKTMTPTVVHYIRAQHIRYLLVDDRMTKGVPPTPGYYFGPAEPGAGTYKHTFSTVALNKFAASNCDGTVHSVGEIQIVDVTQIENGSCTPGTLPAASRSKVTG